VPARRKKRQAASTAYLLEGEDSYLRLQRREEIIAATVADEMRGFAVVHLDLRKTPLAQVLAQASTAPLLSPKQVLVLAPVEALGEEDLARLEEYLEAPAEFTVLVFEAEKLDRRTRAARLLLDRCQRVEVSTPDDSSAQRAVREFARALNVKLSPDTIEDLVFVLGTDQGRLHSELEKLRAYVGPGAEVSSVDVGLLVSSARQFSVFDLVDLLAERRPAEALARLRHLLDAGESPIGIVGLLAWLYRQLLVARALPRNLPPWRAAQALRAPRTRVEALLRQARRFSEEELRAGFEALRDADVDLKSGTPNPSATLEVLVVKLAGTGVGNRSA
jgi:DNA polymerase-3 subunit delta